MKVSYKGSFPNVIMERPRLTYYSNLFRQRAVAALGFIPASNTYYPPTYTVQDRPAIPLGEGELPYELERQFDAFCKSTS